MSQGDVAKRRAALVSELRSLKYAVRYEGGPIERAADELAAAERERSALQDKVDRVEGDNCVNTRLALAVMRENAGHVVGCSGCVTCLTAAANLGVCVSTLQSMLGFPDETVREAYDAELSAALSDEPELDAAAAVVIEGRRWRKNHGADRSGERVVLFDEASAEIAAAFEEGDR